MRAAADLLSTARTTAGLVELATQAGLVEACVRLTSGELRHLGGDELHDAHIGASVGSCRILIGTIEPTSASLREVLHRLARRLSVRAPHVFWLLGIVDNHSHRSALVGWTVVEPGAPRVAAFIWEPDTVVDSDAETLRALSGIGGGQDLVRHERCLEVLGRDAMTRRFFRVLDMQVAALATSCPRLVTADVAREVALLYVTRLLILHFLQAKGWLDGQSSFLADRLDECLLSGGRFHHRVLLPLFFGTLNTPVRQRSAT